MRPNNVQRLHAEGLPIINGWLSIGSGYAAELIAYQGFDSVTVDCQHGMIGFDTALVMLQAVSSTPSTPMVRPSCLDSAQIMRFLDAGSFGIICPMISTADDARALVDACRYPPIGSRSFGPGRGLLYGGADYPTSANATITVLAMIETTAGLENLEAILAVEGLDGIYVGPNDLSLSMGFAPTNESGEPSVREAIGGALRRTRAKGKIAGIFCSDGDAAAMRISQGFHLVTPGNDAALLKRVMGHAVAASRAGSR
jgi:4-hydroxy-2-oxoheptanedioate aldolase